MSNERLVGECPACTAERIVPSKGIAFVLGAYITHQLPAGVGVIFCDKHDADWKEIEESRKFENVVVLVPPSSEDRKDFS